MAACDGWMCGGRAPIPDAGTPACPLVARPAGSRRGITACQLDVKLPGGVPLSILEEALAAAARGRAKLLGVMEEALPKVRRPCPAAVCLPAR